MTHREEGDVKIEQTERFEDSGLENQSDTAHAQECWKPSEAGRGTELILPCSPLPQGKWPCWPPEQWENNLLSGRFF